MITAKDFAEIYAGFSAAISRYDCGRKCAPLNGGQPVCCTTENAIPVVDRAEWQLLKSRSDLWHRFKPYDANGREIVDTLHKSCVAIECKGAAFCERENRSLACRAFPFYPYITAEGEFIGLSCYWIFEDRCWVISHLEVVERSFVKEFVAAYERLFKADPSEFDTLKDHSANHRRVFSRWQRPIPLIGRDGGFFKVLPHGRGIKPAKLEEFKPLGPYRSKTAYLRAVKEAGGTLPPEEL